MRQGVMLRGLGAAGVLISLGSACGNDTAPDQDDGMQSGGSSGSGGTGGTAGSGATGGTAGAGGNGATATTPTSTTDGASAGGTGGTVSNPGLAQACESDEDCDGNLICITAESDSLLAGGPANGICTQVCDSSCDDVDANAICVSFADEDSYCMPLCLPGDGQQECAGRRDLACDVIPSLSERTCSTSAECNVGEGCLDGQCAVPIFLCLPMCGADSDCPDGRYCHPGYGECVDDEPEGLAQGEQCDPAEDECLGYCDTQLTPARCSESCALGAYPACGSDSTEAGTAACLQSFFGEPSDLGDLGICYGLCDCPSACAEGLSCISLEGLGLEAVQGRDGFCDVELMGDVLLTCE